jgi:hypothetical protein
MKLVKIFVEKRTLQEEITMKNKLKKALCLGLVLTMFSTTSVMAATYGYSFGLMPENVQNTAYKAKTGSTAYASVHVTEMNYPSASIKYRTHVADKGFTAEYTEQRGLGTCTVIYNKTVKKLPIPMTSSFGGAVEKYKNLIVFAINGRNDVGFYTHNPATGETSSDAVVKVDGAPAYFHWFEN